MSDIHDRCRADMEKVDIALRAALDEIDRLKAGFLEYGKHKPDCGGADGGSLCTCGFLNAWASFTDPQP